MNKKTTPQLTPVEDPRTITPEQIMQAVNGAVVISIPRCVEVCGGMIARKTFFNLITQGEAPQKIKIGRRTGFRTAEFADWICKRMQAA